MNGVYQAQEKTIVWDKQFTGGKAYISITPVVLCTIIPFLVECSQSFGQWFLRLRLNNTNFLDNNLNLNVILLTLTLFFYSL